MENYINKEGKRLRLGYTTGSCAAAAAKAAARMLLTGGTVERVALITPGGLRLELEIVDIKRGEDRVSCAVIKDSGDDPDITKGAHITATVFRAEQDGISIDGGEGVGRVTKPGLDQPVGAAAINSVPRRMIEENVREVCDRLDYRQGLSVLISVPGGEETAQRTFNPRLGIEGGISILGTSGIVEPMSEQALLDTIRLELRQRRQAGAAYALLCPGNYGRDFIKMALPVDAEMSVQSSNFIGDTLDMCRELGFRGALLVGHIGKLVKIAGGMLNTHSKYGDCRMEILAAHAAACGLGTRAVGDILACVTCDEAVKILKENGMFAPCMKRITERVGHTLASRAGEMEVGAILFSREYGLLSQTENAERLLEKLAEGK